MSLQNEETFLLSMKEGLETYKDYRPKLLAY